MKTTLFFSVLLAFAHASDDEQSIHSSENLDKDVNGAESDAKISPAEHSPSNVSGPFVEQFVNFDRWVTSKAKKIVVGVEDEDLLAYRGSWAHEPATVWPGIDKRSLVVKTAAAHHAISAKFDEVVDSTDKTFVVQYEVKFQKQHDCGGAYLKLLTADDKFEPASFGDKTPYTIMFGPDKCGMNNKVHFIFRHKNPKTGEVEEKHLNNPPQGKIEKKTGLYTLIVKPDNTFEMLINNESIKKGSLFEDFTPPVLPLKEIDDPEDKKPEDWVDEAKIPDPDATKPEDWDEDAPMEIPDEDAEKPSDWLDDEPESVPDPEADKPEDWDDEEDGDWMAPIVPNPKCEGVSGCGEWKRPTKRNPEYKGKWNPPMIDNPEYKGEWAPRKIPNPEYFEDEHPSHFTKMGAVGIELWTMSDGITFDNIYVGYSPEDAKKLATEQWAVKFEIEKKHEEEESPKADENEDTDSSSVQEKAVGFYKQFVAELEVIQRMWKEEGPVETIKQFKFFFISIAFVVYFVFSMISKPFRPAPGTASLKKEKVEEEEEDEQDAAPVKKTAARKRTTKKDDDE